MGECSWAEHRWRITSAYIGSHGKPPHSIDSHKSTVIKCSERDSNMLSAEAFRRLRRPHHPRHTLPTHTHTHTHTHVRTQTDIHTNTHTHTHTITHTATLDNNVILWTKRQREEDIRYNLKERDILYPAMWVSLRKQVPIYVMCAQ